VGLVVAVDLGDWILVAIVQRHENASGYAEPRKADDAMDPCSYHPGDDGHVRWLTVMKTVKKRYSRIGSEKMDDYCQ
jgi:hypothetical protein